MSAKREQRIREAVATCIDDLVALQREGGVAPDRPTARVLNTLDDHGARLRQPPPQLFQALTLPDAGDDPYIPLEVPVPTTGDAEFVITVRVSLVDFNDAWRAIPFTAEPCSEPDEALRERLSALLERGRDQRAEQADAVPALPDAPAEPPAAGTLLAPADPARSRSRFGGVPFLPADHEWPRDGSGRPLHFLAQIDLREVPPNDALPAGGVLALFADALAVEPAFAVQFVDPDAELVRAHPPADTPDDFIRPCAGIRFAPDEADELHRLLGEPDAIQSDPRSELGPGDWQLLLQLDSGEPLDFDFLDSGRLYFLIRAADLQAGRFAQTRLVLQTY